MSQDLDDDDDWELEDDDDEDLANEDPTRQLDVDICPPNLDQKLYDEVVALRDKRLALGKYFLLSVSSNKDLYFDVL